MKEPLDFFEAMDLIEMMEREDQGDDDSDATARDFIGWLYDRRWAIIKDWR